MSLPHGSANLLQWHALARNITVRAFDSIPSLSSGASLEMGLHGCPRHKSCKFSLCGYSLFKCFPFSAIMAPPIVHGPPTNLSPSFLAQSRVPAIYAAVITVSVLCTIAVALRFLCRRFVKATLWWDDWIILVALLVEWALSAVVLYQTAQLNFGKHVELMKPWQMAPFSKTLMSTQLLYYCTQTLTKISLLLLYHRLFSVNKQFRLALFVAGALVIMWWIASFWDTIFQCVPIQASWDKSIKNAKCQSIRSAALGTGISNLILDILFLLLPVPMIWRLHVSRRIKVSLTGIFLLGGLYVFSQHSQRITSSFADNVSVTASASTSGAQSNLAVR